MDGKTVAIGIGWQVKLNCKTCGGIFQALHKLDLNANQSAERIHGNARINFQLRHRENPQSPLEFSNTSSYKRNPLRSVELSESLRELLFQNFQTSSDTLRNPEQGFQTSHFEFVSEINP